MATFKVNFVCYHEKQTPTETLVCPISMKNSKALYKIDIKSPLQAMKWWPGTDASLIPRPRGRRPHGPGMRLGPTLATHCVDNCAALVGLDLCQSLL